MQRDHAVSISGAVRTVPIMSDDRLPVHFNPFRRAATGGRLKGTITFSGMSRLKQTGLRTTGLPIRIDLGFGPGPAGLVSCRGTIGTRLAATCQRCLGEMSLKIEREVELVLVRTDAEAARLWEDYETYEVGEDDRVYTRDFVEDELLLAVPLIPVHEDREQCDAVISPHEASAEGPDGGHGKDLFRALKGLRGKLD